MASQMLWSQLLIGTFVIVGEERDGDHPLIFPGSDLTSVV